MAIPLLRCGRADGAGGKGFYFGERGAKHVSTPHTGRHIRRAGGSVLTWGNLSSKLVKVMFGALLSVAYVGICCWAWGANESITLWGLNGDKGIEVRIQ